MTAFAIMRVLLTLRLLSAEIAFITQDEIRQTVATHHVAQAAMRHVPVSPGGPNASTKKKTLRLKLQPVI